VVQENIPDASQNIIGLGECISSRSRGYIPSLEEFFHLQEKEEEGAEDKIGSAVELDIDCRVEVFGDGSLAFSDLRKILSGSSVRCRVELGAVWE
jgi:hypothetical protein